MAETARDRLITALRNAHAMERQAQELMERRSERTTDHPEVLEDCLRQCGETESTFKDMVRQSAPISPRWRTRWPPT